MKLSDLVGEHILSGIETGRRAVREDIENTTANYVKFTLDGVTYLAMEDPDDGYRSYLRELVIVDETCRIKLPNVQVSCEMWHRCAEDEILVFTDVLNEKRFLAIGTDYREDYYPECIMEYRPEKMHCNQGRGEET